MDDTLTWDFVEWVRSVTKLPVFVKVSFWPFLELSFEAGLALGFNDVTQSTAFVQPFAVSPCRTPAQAFLLQETCCTLFDCGASS